MHAMSAGFINLMTNDVFLNPRVLRQYMGMDVSILVLSRTGLTEDRYKCVTVHVVIVYDAIDFFIVITFPFSHYYDNKSIITKHSCIFYYNYSIQIL